MDAPTPEQLLPVQVPVPLAPAPVVEGSTTLPDSPKNLIYKAYLEGNGQKGPIELAEEFGRPLAEVLHWFKDGHWVAERRRMVAAIKEHVDSVFQELVATNRPKVAAEHLLLGKMGEDLVLDFMEKYRRGELKNKFGKPVTFLSPDALKKMMDAMLAATTVRARAVGISEKAAADAMAQAQAQMPQRMGLLVIGAAPIGVAPQEPRDITAEVHERSPHES